MSWISKDLMSGLGVPVLLSIINEGEIYGYDIIKQIRALTDDQISWQEGSLYPLLNKLETRGWIKSDWKKLDKGGQRRYYTITEAGVDELHSRLASWRFVTDTLLEINSNNPKCLDILLGTEES